ncbi:MAG TPA: sigma-70 family RNA polymerase sigma factor [Streptosporangiaceae bacterium]
MRDRDIVAAIVAGDSDGLAQAYDKYAARLFGFCRSRLREPDDAAAAVRDTFLIAASRLDQLGEPDRLRPWLYAVARHECQRRLRDGAAPAALGETTEPDGPGADADDLAARAQLRDLVRAAILGLSAGDQEVIELSLRHDLYGPDLADVLGVPREHAYTLAVRARGQLEESLGVLLVTLASRDACPDLDLLRDGWDGALTADFRQRAGSHIERCPACGERRRRELQPIMRLGFAPLAIIPAALRAELLELAADPSAAAERTAIVQRAGQFGAAGFPATAAAAQAPGAAGTVRAVLDRAQQRWPRARGRTAVITGSAATAAVVGAIAVVVMVLPQATHQGRTVLRSPGTARTAGRPTATVTPAASQPARTRPDASSSAAGSLTQQHASRPARPAPAGHGAPGTAAGDAPGAAATSGSTTSASGPATSAPPTVTVTPGTLVLAGLLGSATGTVTLSAGSAPTHYTVSIPSSLAGHLTASPASGSIPAHGHQRVTVTLKGLLSVDSTITVNPGGHPVTVLLGVHLGG